MAEQEIIPAGAPVGRPLTYSDAIATEICERLASDESLRSICESDHMPSLPTVYRWRRDIPEFRERYACAREDQGHTAADLVSHIRTQMLKGQIPHEVARVAIQSAQWESGKRASKDFGDKLQVESRNLNAAVTIPDDAIDAAKAYEDFIKGGNK